MGNRTSITFTRRATLALALLLLPLLSFGPQLLPAPAAKAAPGSKKQSKKKISDELLVRKRSGKERLSVIVNLNGEASKGLQTLLRRGNVSLRGEFKGLRAKAVDLPPAAIDDLASYPEVDFVSSDRELRTLGHLEATTGAAAMRAQTGNGALTGKDFNIAVLDSGVARDHHSFNSIAASVDFTGEGTTADNFGHGTHVASMAAGRDHVLDGAFTGIAPESNVINLRVLDTHGVGRISNVLAAFDWLLASQDPAKAAGEKNFQKFKIRVVNLSLGAVAVDSYRDDPLCRAARRLVDAGLVVVAAAGNDGKDRAGNKLYGAIHSPGNEPSVITVGAANTFGTDTRADDAVTSYSSRGPTRGFWTDAAGVRHHDNLIKPDLVAPGNKLLGAQARNNALSAENPDLPATPEEADNHKQMFLSGTSMAAPVVAGAAALVLQANPNLTPNMVKLILTYTAQPLAGYNAFEQGAGQLNVEGAVRLAKLVRADLTAATPAGAPLLKAAPPAPETTLEGHAFPWAQGLILGNTYAAGPGLVTKYQKVYGRGMVLGDLLVASDGIVMGDRVSTADGYVLGDGIMLADAFLFGDGIVLGDRVVTSDGGPLGGGEFFLSTGTLATDGIVLGDSGVLGDGIVLGDDYLVGDGIVLGDRAVNPLSTLVNGDPTPSMQTPRNTRPRKQH